jgi:hypothetical protein
MFAAKLLLLTSSVLHLLDKAVELPFHSKQPALTRWVLPDSSLETQVVSL